MTMLLARLALGPRPALSRCCARAASSTPSSSRWKQRQGRDKYARDAKVLALKSRAAFKLLEVSLLDPGGGREGPQALTRRAEARWMKSIASSSPTRRLSTWQAFLHLVTSPFPSPSWPEPCKHHRHPADHEPPPPPRATPPAAGPKSPSIAPARTARSSAST